MTDHNRSFPFKGRADLLTHCRSGSVHPAWRYGIGAMLACFVLTEAITYTPVGTAIYRVTTAGSPGAAVPALDFAPPPATALVTGRN